MIKKLAAYYSFFWILFIMYIFFFQFSDLLYTLLFLPVLITLFRHLRNNP